MTPYQIILTIKACVLLGFLGLAYWLGGQGARADFADYKTKMIAATAKVADKALETERRVRAGEHAKAAELAAIAEKYEKDKVANEQKQDRLVADLHAGNVRLRQLWKASAATAKLSNAVACASLADGDAKLREEAIGRVLRAGADADAQIRGLQEVIKADRK